MGGIVLDRIDEQASPRYSILQDSFSNRCQSTLDIEIKNHGRFGNTTCRGLRELERWQEHVTTSEFVVLEFGGNHSWRQIADDPDGEHHPITSLERFEEQYRQMIAKVRELGSKPVLLSLPPIIADRYFDMFTRSMDTARRSNVLRWLDGCVENITQWHEMYNLRLFKLSASLNVPIIDITPPFLFERNYREMFCSDGIHPNARGHRLIADAICNVAGKYL